MKKTLIIRADANTRMGTGHVMRCIALGQAWQDAGGDVLFISCCESDPLKQRIKEEGFKLKTIPFAHPETKDDVQQTIALAQENSAKWIVTDGYHFDLSYQQAIRNAGFKLLYIDDYNHLPEYEVDILLNQNIGAEEINYQCNSICRKLLGTRYVMLRREFRKASVKKSNKKEITNILVTMGGSDPDNVTLKVLQILDDLNIKNLVVKVLLGPSNPHFNKLKEAIAQIKTECELIRSVKDMPTLIRWADFAITAAGSTCWELAALRVPFVTVVLADNQEQVALRLEQVVGVKRAGKSGSDLQKQLHKYCANIFQDKQEKCNMIKTKLSGLVDLLGVDRVLDHMLIKTTNQTELL